MLALAGVRYPAQGREIYSIGKASFNQHNKIYDTPNVVLVIMSRSADKYRIRSRAYDMKSTEALRLSAGHGGKIFRI